MAGTNGTQKRTQGLSRTKRFDSEPANPAKTQDEAQKDYRSGLDAADPNNRFMRIRRGLGGSGDSQLTARELWTIRETARHMVLNDTLPGMAMERLADALYGVYRLDAMTGDKSLNEELSGRWKDYAGDKSAVDFYGRQTLDELFWTGGLSTIRDGDSFAVFLDNGQIQLIEADRCVSVTGNTRFDPRKIGPQIVNGIMLDGRSVPAGYQFVKKTPRTWVASASDIVTQVPRFDSRGLELVAHFYDIKRITANRGYTWWLPNTITSGMLDDLEFAMLVKAQTSASITWLAERDETAPATNILGPGERVVNKDAPDSTTEQHAIMKPGGGIELPPGTNFKGFTPAVPNSEHFKHVQHQVKKLAAALHQPWMMLLLDGSATNFTGWRGAETIARRTWRRLQRTHISQGRTPAYKWQLARWLPALGPTARRLFAQGQLSKHKFIPPQWPYIKPLEDAQADALTLSARLNSPRGLQAERGRDYADVARETVEDNGLMIEIAIKEAARLNGLDPEANVNWRELIRWDLGKGMNLTGVLVDADGGDGGTDDS